MKKILLIYATHSGSTFVAAQIIKEILSTNFEVVMQNALESKPTDIKNYDTVILGSPSWFSRGEEGMPSETMLKLTDVWGKQNLSNKHFAVYGCGDDSYMTFCGAVNHLENFVKNVKGNFMLPSLRLNGFFFDVDKNVEQVKKWAADLKVKAGTIW